MVKEVGLLQLFYTFVNLTNCDYLNRQIIVQKRTHYSCFVATQ